MSFTYTATQYAGDTGVPTTVVAVGDDSNEADARPFAARTLSVNVNFGIIESTRAVTTVLLCPWVKRLRRPLAQAVGRPIALGTQASDDEVLTNGVQAIVTNIVDGVSFDVVAFCATGINGTVQVQVLGV